MVEESGIHDKEIERLPRICRGSVKESLRSEKNHL